MLGLQLRPEFAGRRHQGTAIELANKTKTGATQIGASAFLEITYPTADVLTALEAIGPDQGRPIVLIGERGQGKSHLMGVLFHALSDPNCTAEWLSTWADRLGLPQLNDMRFRPPTVVISESLQKQNSKFLWDILFRHPDGDYIRGKWEAQGDKQTDIPGEELLLELFRKKPVALILDEFQTWYDGLTDTKQTPYKKRAFNFIQLLSEIAKEHPELLVLVVSVRSGESDAYQQIHRDHPVRIDFKGPNARQDRLRLLLHRLFTNRTNIHDDQIERLISHHVAELLRQPSCPPAEHERIRQEYLRAWPFAPSLMTLLEDQVLVATQAQETRDLIRILADLFKAHGETSQILTAADFHVDEERNEITSLLDSVANKHHATLRQKAQRNLLAVQEALTAKEVPHLSEIMGALWLRSLAVKNAGALPADLKIDITRAKPIDDNAFQVELENIVDCSYNIHPEGERLVFREDENAQAKLRASAKNDKLFESGADLVLLSKEVRFVLAGSGDTASTYRVIVLSLDWLTDPWSISQEPPDIWDERIPLLVLPESPEHLNVRLGKWLKDQLLSRRNAVRFLLPQASSGNLFLDRELVLLARKLHLAGEWKAQNAEFRRLEDTFRRELRGTLKDRFDRFAILGTWNFQEPAKCTFRVESHRFQGDKIPEEVDKQIARNLFVTEDFEALVLEAARQNESIGKLLKELQEPRPNGEECIPWLGEAQMIDKLVNLCARGVIAINLRGLEYLQRKQEEDESTAQRRMGPKIGRGRHLDETLLLLPQAVPHADGVTPQVPVAPVYGGQPQLPLTGGAPPENPSPTPPIPGAPTPEIFAAPVTLRELKSPGATSALNLLGKVEGWGIGTGTRVQDVQIRVDHLTGAQLNDLLKKLPDGITYELSLSKEERDAASS